MLKEIFEQPEALENCLRGRLDPSEPAIHLGGLVDCTRELTRAKRCILTACGAAWHAAPVGAAGFWDMSIGVYERGWHSQALAKANPNVTEPIKPDTKIYCPPTPPKNVYPKSPQP